jgi:hypothetical protein
MMSTARWRTSLVVVLSLSYPALALGQNLDAAHATHLMVGQIPVSVGLSTATPNGRWYDIQGAAGRSYCAEVTTDVYEYAQVDPKVTIYATDGTTETKSNDNVTTEPAGQLVSRACWIDATGTASGYVKVESRNAVAWDYVHALRVVETSLWSSWFFIGGDYNSFLLLRNTTGSTVNMRVTYRTADGTVVGTFSGSIGPHAGLGVNARNYITVLSAINGTVELAHDGSPEALVGQMTSLSATTGVGFDAPLFQRRPW